MPKTRRTYSTYDYENLTVAASAVRIDLAKILATPQVEEVEIFVENAQIRFLKDGDDPTSSVGEVLNPFDRLVVDDKNDIVNLRFIRTGGTSATLRIHFKR